MGRHPRELDPASSPKAFFGAELRRLREEAGLSQERLGELVFCSGTYIGQIETAVRSPQLDLAERIDEVLQTGGYLARLCPMVMRSRHARFFAAAAELETAATTISQYAGALIPGLLQTESYTRALIRAAFPRLPKSELDERVAARMERARLLDGAAQPELWVILHEAALRPVVGTPLIAAEQLLRIGEVACEGRVLVQVLPFSSGAHATNSGSFRIMTFADAPPMVYEEGQYAGQLLDDPALVAMYQRGYDLARAVALSPEASLALIESAAEEHTK